MLAEGAQVELGRERCVPKVLKLSAEVSECRPLTPGTCNFAKRMMRVTQAGAYTRPLLGVT